VEHLFKVEPRLYSQIFEQVVGIKRSSLFILGVSDEENEIYNVDTCRRRFVVPPTFRRRQSTNFSFDVTFVVVKVNVEVIVNDADTSVVSETLPAVAFRRRTCDRRFGLGRTQQAIVELADNLESML
jgi:hypothetical protein